MSVADFEQRLLNLSGFCCCFCNEPIYGEIDLRNADAYVIKPEASQGFVHPAGTTSPVLFFCCGEYDTCRYARQQRGVQDNESQWRIFETDWDEALGDYCLTWPQVRHSSRKVSVRQHLQILPEAARFEWAVVYCRSIVTTACEQDALETAIEIHRPVVVEPSAPHLASDGAGAAHLPAPDDAALGRGADASSDGALSDDTQCGQEKAPVPRPSSRGSGCAGPPGKKPKLKHQLSDRQLAIATTLLTPSAPAGCASRVLGSVVIIELDEGSIEEFILSEVNWDDETYRVLRFDDGKAAWVEMPDLEITFTGMINFLERAKRGDMYLRLIDHIDAGKRQTRSTYRLRDWVKYHSAGMIEINKLKSTIKDMSRAEVCLTEATAAEFAKRQKRPEGEEGEEGEEEGVKFYVPSTEEGEAEEGEDEGEEEEEEEGEEEEGEEEEEEGEEEEEEEQCTPPRVRFYQEAAAAVEETAAAVEQEVAVSAAAEPAAPKVEAAAAPPPPEMQVEAAVAAVAAEPGDFDNEPHVDMMEEADRVVAEGKAAEAEKAAAAAKTAAAEAAAAKAAAAAAEVEVEAPAAAVAAAGGAAAAKPAADEAAAAAAEVEAAALAADKSTIDLTGSIEDEAEQRVIQLKETLRTAVSAQMSSVVKPLKMFNKGILSAYNLAPRGKETQLAGHPGPYTYSHKGHHAFFYVPSTDFTPAPNSELHPVEYNVYPFALHANLLEERVCVQPFLLLRKATRRAKGVNAVDDSLKRTRGSSVSDTSSPLGELAHTYIVSPVCTGKRTHIPV